MKSVCSSFNRTFSHGKSTVRVWNICPNFSSGGQHLLLPPPPNIYYKINIVRSLVIMEVLRHGAVSFACPQKGINAGGKTFSLDPWSLFPKKRPATKIPTGAKFAAFDIDNRLTGHKGGENINYHRCLPTSTALSLLKIDTISLTYKFQHVAVNECD